MLTLVDRVCEHGFVYCPVAGCHDNIEYDPGYAGVELFQEMAELVANDDLPSFYTRPDPWSGYDGADEGVDAAMMMLTIERWDE